MEKIVVKIKIPAAGLPTHRSLHVAQLLLLVSRQILYPPGPGHDVSVTLKRKTREVLIPSSLCTILRVWCAKQGITSGCIFVTRSGRPVDRSNVLHWMKSLADDANVDRSKIFPHNLRHLFAVNYYENEKDIVRLADLLGHSSINTTRIYTMTTREREQNSVDRIAALLLTGT